eukprot:TRINITY_DN14705_c0_g1_i1.p1 TRINITY_DN14705_c0_g1~~TRINITY_DN14705_c0_g1_i1.p1  ORF type:complete len:122 (-),score=27.74 TRINITY_DN14705_c0_g1_i1:4-339(-)
MKKKNKSYVDLNKLKKRTPSWSRRKKSTPAGHLNENAMLKNFPHLLVHQKIDSKGNLFIYLKDEKMVLKDFLESDGVQYSEDKSTITAITVDKLFLYLFDHNGKTNTTKYY